METRIVGGRQDDLIPLDFDPPQTPIDWPEQILTGPLKLFLAIVIAAIVLAVIALGAIADRAYLFAPYSDHHAWIARVFAAEPGGHWASYAWAAHNDQRIPIARLVTAYDIEVAKGRWPSFLLAGAAAWLIGLAALFVGIARSPYSLSVRLGVALIAGLIACNIALAEDFAFPVFSVYLFVAGPALATLCLTSLLGAQGWRSPAFWAAAAYAGLASLGNAAGLAVWPALLLALALQGQSRFTLGLAAGLMALCVLVVESGLGPPTGTAVVSGAGPHPLKMLLYFLIFGGLPWSRALHAIPVQALIGAAVWAVAVVAVWRNQRESVREPLQQAGVALVLFGFLTAALATVGRVDELPTPIVPSRYTPFATALQIGVILASLGALNRMRLQRPAVFSALVGAVALACFGLMPHGASAILRSAVLIRASGAQLDATGRQTEVSIYPWPAQAAAVRAELARRGLPH